MKDERSESNIQLGCLGITTPDDEPLRVHVSTQLYKLTNLLTYLYLGEGFCKKIVNTNVLIVIDAIDNNCLKSFKTAAVF